MSSTAPFAPEVLAAVRALEVRARRSVREGLGGRWRSAVRGAGIEFAEVREYVPGDDARSVDWNVTARTGRLQVKRFDEEREQTLFFLVDRSASTQAVGVARPWVEAAAEVIALLGLAGAEAGDRIGAALFSDGIERVVAPRHGANHVLALAAQLLAAPATPRGTRLDAVLQSFLRIRTRPCLLVLLSDLHDDVSDATLAATARRHDFVTVALRGPLADALPTCGLVPFVDPELGTRFSVDLSDRRVRALLAERMEADRARWRSRLRSVGAGLIELSTELPLAPPLVAWCRRRMGEVAA